METLIEIFDDTEEAWMFALARLAADPLEWCVWLEFELDDRVRVHACRGL